MSRMLRLDWRKPGIGWAGGNAMGSDTSPVNLYLLRDKCRIEVAEQDGILFRRYSGDTPNQRGYGFPLSPEPFDVGRALAALRYDAKERGETLHFCLCDEKQQKAIDSFCMIPWQFHSGDGDYIYKRESLAKLSGRKLHSKKNHVNRFWRLYPEAVYLPLDAERLPDALKVAMQWKNERREAEPETETDVETEWGFIQEAAAYWDRLKMMGGVLYVGDEPVAMTMASALSPQCLDIHYEKAVGAFAADGAFAVINQCFAASEETRGYIYFNREEDMGLEGLRQAKESYQPCLRLEKYYGDVSKYYTR